MRQHASYMLTALRPLGASLYTLCTFVALFFDTEMASVQHTPELWITYHQVSRAQKPVTAQLIEVSDGTQLFDLEDVLDHVFQQGFVDPNWRSVVWLEDRDSVRLKTSHTVKDLLVHGAGTTPESALRLVICMSCFFCSPCGTLTHLPGLS